MQEHTVKILEKTKVTHNVRSFIVERPDNLEFKPGQATEVSIPVKGWKDARHPFTFTSLTDDDFLQFIIKIYKDHKGMTRKLDTLKAGDHITLHEVFGAINYEGPGTFIAGGAGITPFISIARNMQAEDNFGGNRLIFANKTRKDIILPQELETLFDDGVVNILSDENAWGYPHGVITKDFLKSQMGGNDRMFYLCGPPPMMDSVLEQLNELGIPEKSIVTEEM